MALIRPRGDGSAAVVKVDDPHELRNVFAGSTGNRSDLVAPISAALKTGLAFVVPA